MRKKQPIGDVSVANMKTRKIKFNNAEVQSLEDQIQSIVKKDSQKRDSASAKRSEHTPTPWSLTAYGLSAHAVSTDDLKTTFAVEAMGAVSLGEAKANAAFIVRAVNAHDALVTSLKELLEIVGQSYKVEMVLPAYERALASIEKAEGK